MLQHNKVRNITGSLLKEVCRDVRVEPSLLELNGKQIIQKTTTDKCSNLGQRNMVRREPLILRYHYRKK